MVVKQRREGPTLNMRPGFRDIRPFEDEGQVLEGHSTKG